MYRRLLSEAWLYSASSVLARGLSLITVPIFTRVLSPGDYGALDLLSYFAVLVPLVAGVALDQALGRFYAQTSDVDERKRMASTVLLYTVLVYVPMIPFARPIADYVSRQLLSGQVDRMTVLLAFASVWTTAFGYIANNQLKYLFRARAAATCQIGYVVTATLLVLYLVVIGRMGVAGVFLGQSLAHLAFGALAIYFARDTYCWCFDREILARLMRYSLPLVPGTLAVYAALYVDRYTLNAFRGLGEVGIYGMGARVATLVNLFLGGFQGAWMPRVMGSFRQDETPEQVATVFRYYVAATMALLLLLSVFGREIVTVLTAPAFREGFVVIPLLVLATVLASIANYFSFGIQIGEKSYTRLLLNGCALGLCIALNLLLVPRCGAIGAALSNAISFLALAIAAVSISQRLYRVPYPWAAVVLSIVIAFSVSELSVILRPEVGIATAAIKLAVVVATLAIIVRILGVRLNTGPVRNDIVVPRSDR